MNTASPMSVLCHRLRIDGVFARKLLLLMALPVLLSLLLDGLHWLNMEVEVWALPYSEFGWAILERDSPVIPFGVFVAGTITAFVLYAILMLLAERGYRALKQSIVLSFIKSLFVEAFDKPLVPTPKPQVFKPTVLIFDRALVKVRRYFRISLRRGSILAAR